MKQITKVDKLVGKTIKSTYGLDGEEEVVITLNDDTFAVLTVLHWGEYSTGIELDTDPIGPYLAKRSGVITEEEFDRLMEEQKKKWAARQEEVDRKNLRRLMDKYPDERGQ